ncbi:MAG: tRNA (adenosine(37)-N6)-dimethylallyltransferase MiaA [Candidatus Roizmanbacteria bacterium]|nr:tRNA (adenosine(37)-N6)-dimethylallyltransferase MiaA [Candidatus Roizmanbacteria bacterium]
MIIITGQTATGKTKLALELAKKYNGELINFDSRQIYKYLDIITGKDKDVLTMKQWNNVTIWLYDIVSPNQYFSSFDFVKLAIPIIKDIQDRKKIPILVGGTYLYLKHLLYGIDDNNPPNFKLREKLNNKSVSYLQKYLISLNPQIFESLNHSDQLNPRRLMRRIEIETGPVSPSFPSGFGTQKVASTPPGSLKSRHPFQFKIIGLKYKDKSKLRQVIEKRVEERLKNGAIDEVKKILEMGYKESDPGLKTIGYQQIIKYLNKKLIKEKAIEDWINKEVQYAKRQLTFMKKDKNIEWREID